MAGSLVSCIATRSGFSALIVSNTFLDNTALADSDVRAALMESMFHEINFFIALCPFVFYFYNGVSILILN